MTNRETDRRRARRLRGLRDSLGTEIRRLRQDAGLSLVRVADAADISRSHLAEVELGTADPSLRVLAAIGDALGADLSIRLFPTTGPRIRDHLQAPIVEAVLKCAHPRWRRWVEVPVYRPARGIIDVVLHDPAQRVAVAVEVHSQVRRVEQLIGWARLKSESLPSADLWRFVDEPPAIGSLLVLRSTRSTRDVAVRFEETFRSAYPAPAEAARAALMGEHAWPGSALLWADVGPDGVRILERPPRNVRVGR